jgi:heme oxygenase
LESKTVPAIATPSVVVLLRQRTRPLHDQIEAGIDMQKALASPAAYRAMLEGYLGLYRPFEAALAGAAPEVRGLAHWPAGARVPLLERDILALGATREELQRVPDAPGLPDLGEESAMLGALYVVEGSQLGGQMIFRDVQTKLRLDAATGGAFFAGAGGTTGPRWKEFLAGLEGLTKDAERASEAACAMFHYFGSWLGKATQRQEIV